jgi:hypothetical protein
MSNRPKAIKRTPRSVAKEAPVRRSKAAKVFCEKNVLEECFFTAVHLANKCFPTLKSLKADVLQDPEADNDAWIDLLAKVSGTPEQILAAFDNYLSEWSRSVPASQRQMIVLTFHFI